MKRGRAEPSLESIFGSAGWRTIERMLCGKQALLAKNGKDLVAQLIGDAECFGCKDGEQLIGIRTRIRRRAERAVGFAADILGAPAFLSMLLLLYTY